MKIYIYGNQSFKKEINNTLEHSNIKLKLDNDVTIEEIRNINELKEIIKINPNDIYLIDDDKIIKKNSLNKKLKLFMPKDGIEEEYLLQSGVSDLSIDSLKELPKYIIKRYEELNSSSLEQKNGSEIMEQVSDSENSEKDVIELDDELSMLLTKGDENNDKNHKDIASADNLDDIFGLEQDINLDELENLVDIDDDEIKSQENDISQSNIDFNNDFGLNNISFDYDDNNIVHKEIKNIDEKSINILDDLGFLSDEISSDDFLNLEKVDDDLFSDLDFLDAKSEIKEELDEEFNGFDYPKDNIDIKEEKEFLQGDKKMDDEFFELNLLNEKDILEALNCEIKDDVRVDSKSIVQTSKNETISVDSSNVNDLSLLLSRLLNNKTLEITIKIKD